MYDGMRVVMYYYRESDNSIHGVPWAQQPTEPQIEISQEEAELLVATGAILCGSETCSKKWKMRKWRKRNG
jgi:hypothetical protein